MALAIAISAVFLAGWVALASTLPPEVRPGSMFKVTVGHAHGSGTHIGNGYILTAEHVIASAKGLPVKLLSDKGDVRKAEILWSNVEYDLALLKADKWADMEVSPVSCRKPLLGEPVTARGNPMNLEFITTHGHIAGISKLNSAFKARWKSYVFADFTLQRGMSGGPVFDKEKNLIGVLVGMIGLRLGRTPMVASQGFAFVVPADAVCRLIPDIR